MALTELSRYLPRPDLRARFAHSELRGPVALTDGSPAATQTPEPGPEDAP
jgi:hypothetical protein